MALTTNHICPFCGKSVSSLNEYTGWCKDCSSTNPEVQLEDYLAKNADHLEHYISQGQSIEDALKSIRRDTRPICSCCGVVINHAPRKSLFCSRNAECRSAKHRYEYLWKKKGMPKHQALSQVLREIGSSDN